MTNYRIEWRRNHRMEDGHDLVALVVSGVDERNALVSKLVMTSNVPNDSIEVYTYERCDLEIKSDTTFELYEPNLITTANVVLQKRLNEAKAMLELNDRAVAQEHKVSIMNEISSLVSAIRCALACPDDSTHILRTAMEMHDNRMDPRNEQEPSPVRAEAHGYRVEWKTQDSSHVQHQFVMGEDARDALLRRLFTQSPCLNDFIKVYALIECQVTYSQRVDVRVTDPGAP